MSKPTQVDWKMTRLDQVIDQFIVPMRDKPPVWAGDIPWCRIEDFEGKYLYGSKSHQCVDAGLVKLMNLKVFPAGTLLCSCSATLGICTIAARPLVSNQTFIGLVPKRTAHTEFLYYKLTALAGVLQGMSSGTTIAYLPRSRFESLEIELPPLAQQDRIAEILSTLDEAIEQTEALIAKHQQIKAGLMHDLFTRGVTPDGHLRPTREQAPDLYKKSPLGWTPKEWECLTVDQLLAKTACPMRSGPFGSALLKDELVEEGIPFLGIDNIFAEHFEPTFHRFVSKWKFHELIRYSVFPRDVIITIMGTVGRSCVVPDDITKALSSKHLWTMTFNAERVFPELVCWQLNHARWVKDWFARQSQGAVMEAIQSSTLRNLKLPVPPIEEQHQILEHYLLCSRRIETEDEHLAKLLQQKHGLMHDLLTGRVPVNINEVGVVQ